MSYCETDESAFSLELIQKELTTNCICIGIGCLNNLDYNLTICRSKRRPRKPITFRWETMENLGFDISRMALHTSDPRH